jgi:hypothetical protein
MKLLGLWLSFIVALMASCRANAEYVDNLPPIPYQAYALIRGATINLPMTQFAEAIVGSDPEKRAAILLKQRGGKEGQELWGAIAKCDDKTIPSSDDRKVRCMDIANELTFVINTILLRDYGRAVFKLAGYSFDKSIVVFANDCNTFGSCEIVHKKILELTNNMESMAPPYLFGHLCGSNNQSIRKRFLPSNVAAACTKMVSSAPFKEEICKIPVRDRSLCDDKVKSKTRYCTETGNLLYPEIDCN